MDYLPIICTQCGELYDPALGLCLCQYHNPVAVSEVKFDSDEEYCIVDPDNKMRSLCGEVFVGDDDTLEDDEVPQSNTCKDCLFIQQQRRQHPKNVRSFLDKWVVHLPRERFRSFWKGFRKAVNAYVESKHPTSESSRLTFSGDVYPYVVIDLRSLTRQGFQSRQAALGFMEAFMHQQPSLLVHWDEDRYVPSKQVAV